MKYRESLKHFLHIWNRLLTDDFDDAFDWFLLESFSCLFNFYKIILKRGNKGGQMASVLTFELFKKFPLDVVIMLIDFGNGFLSILFNDFSVLFKAKLRSKLSVLNK